LNNEEEGPAAATTETTDETTDETTTDTSRHTTTAASTTSTIVDTGDASSTQEDQFICELTKTYLGDKWPKLFIKAKTVLDTCKSIDDLSTLWKNVDAVEEAPHKKADTLAGRRAKRKFQALLPLLYTITNGDYKEVKEIFTLSLRSIEGETSCKEGDIASIICNALKKSLLETKPGCDGGGTYRSDIYDCVHGLSVLIENGLPNDESIHVNYKAITERLGMSKRIAVNARKSTQDLESLGDYCHPVRDTRNDCARNKAKHWVKLWIHEDDDSPTTLTNRSYSRNTAKFKKRKNSTNSVTVEECPPRVWEGVVTKKDKYDCFKKSDTYIKQFKMIYPQIDIGFNVFCESICKCVKNPTMESCVDVDLSAAEEAMRGASAMIRKSAEIRQKFAACKCPVHAKENREAPTLDEDLRSTTNVFSYVCGTCCTAKEDPKLGYDPKDKEYIPKFIPRRCVGEFNKGELKNDTPCEACGIRIRYADITECPVWNDEHLNMTKFTCNVWEKKQVGGNCNPSKKKKEQMTMFTQQLNMKEILALFERTLEKARTHYVYFKWSDYQRKLNTVMSDPRKAKLICTDFGSLMETTSDRVDNNHIPERLIRGIYFIYSAHKEVIYSEDGEEQAHISVRCDVRHYVSTPIKSKSKKSSTDQLVNSEADEVLDETGGKSQDTCFHIHCLHDIITDSECERILIHDENGKPTIFHYIIWTDNCPNQYKNRFNFMYIASINDLFPGRGLRLIQCFAQKFRFKGCWDADGRIDKAFVKKRALEKRSCQDALDFFKQIRESEFQFVKPPPPY